MMSVSANHYKVAYIGFQLVPKSVTLNDLERRNRCCVI